MGWDGGCHVNGSFPPDEEIFTNNENERLDLYNFKEEIILFSLTLFENDRFKILLKINVGSYYKMSKSV